MTKPGLKYRALRKSRIVWLPELIASRDNLVVSLVSREGTIHKVWVGPQFAGPLTPDELSGLHIRDLLIPEDVDRIRKLLTTRAQTAITLSLDVRHKHREVRILPFNGDITLVYINKTRRTQ